MQLQPFCMVDAVLILESAYACLRSSKPNSVLDLINSAESWQLGSDITLLHALLHLLEFASTLKLPNIGPEGIERSGRSVLVTVRVCGQVFETDLEIDFTVAHLWTFREDGLIAFQWFASLEEAQRILRR